MKLNLSEEEIKEAILAYLDSNDILALCDDEQLPNIQFLHKDSTGAMILQDADKIGAEIFFEIEITSDHPYR